MVRAVLYLAMGLVATSAIATEISQRSKIVSCSGVRVAANATVAMKRTVAQETCVASAAKR